MFEFRKLTDKNCTRVNSFVPFADTKHKYPHFRDPKLYKGETLKEATLFLKSLKMIFKINRASFTTDEDKVLYTST
jgi:hypothetical protein